MNSRTTGLLLAGAVFALVSLLQLMRLLTGLDVQVAGHAIPPWPSAVAFVIAATLSFWMLRLSRRGAT